MTREEAVRQNPDFICPPGILERQALVQVEFYDFTGERRTGEIVIDKDLQKDVQKLFALILREKFPLSSVIPLAHPGFAWSDERSMQANNTSGFNYRFVARTDRLSNHALGRAIDINPRQNPYITERGVEPEGARYDLTRPGTIVPGSPIVQFLKGSGWIWGGDWNNKKDYQHFEKGSVQ